LTLWYQPETISMTMDWLVYVTLLFNIPSQISTPPTAFKNNGRMVSEWLLLLILPCHQPLHSFTLIMSLINVIDLLVLVLGNHDYRGDAEAQLSPFLQNIDHRWFCQRSFFVHTGNPLIHLTYQFNICSPHNH